MKTICFVLVIVSILFACQQADIDPVNDFTLAPLPLQASSGMDNPTTEEKVLLGKLLFYDPILSANKKVACATCHHPSKGYADGLDLSIGFDGTGLAEQRKGRIFTRRNAPTILNAAFNGIKSNGDYSADDAVMFWDNRASSLEEQCFGPLLSEEEMRGMDYPLINYIDTLENRLNAIPDYKVLFFHAFGDSVATIENTVKAIASFERTLITPNARFDEFARGNKHALSEREIRGLEAFFDAGCQNCHSGPMFSDFKLHTLGVEENDKLDKSDEGNGDYAFRTPTLRNLSYTAPYMHNGTHQTLEEVMTFYEGKASENPHVLNDDLAPEFLSLNMRPFDASRKQEIIAFLKALDDPNFDKSIPENVPSGLAVGGEINLP